MSFSSVPIIDISPLLGSNQDDRDRAGEKDRVIKAIGHACRTVGFFYVVGHGVDEALQNQLADAARAFFALPRATKRRFEMAKGGKAWRGYFEVGEELTSGVVDEKEGLYFGEELPASDPRPLHGPNFWPTGDAVGADLAAALRASVTGYMDAMTALGHTLLAAIAASLGLRPDHFGAQFRAPTKLFRVFHYPPHDPAHPDSFAVGEHSDYGYVTILKQDASGGLQVKNAVGHWVDAPPVPNSFVINLGDALEHNTGSLLRATPHRVRQRTGATAGRYSFPFFFDPSFDARLESVVDRLPPALRREAARRRAAAPARWDGKDVNLFDGTYGDYLLAKVSRVFPELAKATPEVQSRL